MKINDKMQDIVNTVIAAIESGTAPWQKPWQDIANTALPINMTTGKNYSGMNMLYLDLIANALFAGCNQWAGFNQWKDKGGQVRKGSKAIYVLVPMLVDKEKGNKESGKVLIGFKTQPVFNLMQVDGIELPAEETTERKLDAPMLDSFIVNTNAEVQYGGNRACFIPSMDLIQLPHKHQFNSEAGFYGTAIHELIHWTGSSKRLDRIKGNPFGSEGYAYEELIAELGAYYTCRVMGTPNEAENHSSYLQSWLKALNNDPEFLFKAAGEAQKASTYLIKLGTQEGVAAA